MMLGSSAIIAFPTAEGGVTVAQVGEEHSIGVGTGQPTVLWCSLCLPLQTIMHPPCDRQGI